MMKILFPKIPAALLLLFCGPLFSQTPVPPDRAIRQLFPKPEKVQWVKYFKGRFDGLSDASIALAYDGKNCKGEMTYLRSKEKFRLDGTLTNGQLRLQEIDRQDAISGYIKGRFGDKIKAEWTNFDQSIGAALDILAVEKEWKLPTPCSDDKWINSYAGFVARQPVDLILQKEANQQVRGMAYFASSNKTVTIRGEFDAENNLSLNLMDEKGEKQGQIKAQLNDIQEWKGLFTHPDLSKNTASFSLRENLLMGCLDYADYTSTYDVTYPKAKNDAFNAHIEKLVNDWVGGCKVYLNRLKSQSPNPEPSQRACLRASGWANISFIGEEVISGFLVFSQTWNPVQETRAFNFDPQTSREIRLDELFVKGFDFKKFVEQKIRQEAPKHPSYKDPDFKSWIDQETFPFFTFRRDGLCFSTAFNAIYGQQQVIIPFRMLEPYLVKNSAAWMVSRKLGN